MRFKQIFLFLVIVFSLTSCQKVVNKKYTIKGHAQGSYYSMLYYTKQNCDYKASIDSILRRVDQSVSLWDPSSIIVKVNRGKKVILDQIFIDNFNLSKKIFNQSNGYFDPTVAPLAKIYGFHLEKRNEISETQINEILQNIGLQKVVLIDNRLLKENRFLEFDFNAIAQGYSVDLIGDFLEKNGVDNYLIDIGGEVFAKGKKPTGKWLVGIEKPNDKSDKRILDAKVALLDKALATSGSYRKFYEENGQRFSHTINPKTGKPVTHSLLSASVLADDCATADAWATAFMVMGFEKAKEILGKHPELGAYFIYSDEKGELKNWYSKRFEKIIVID